ncbi:MAG: cytochrome P450 [Myxococcota bacterium]
MSMLSLETTDLEIDDIDLADRDLFRHGFPHHVFSLLRREAPVWRHPETPGCAEIDHCGFWVLSKYEDIQAANRDTELFTAVGGPAMPPRPERMGHMLVSMDGGAHTRQRKLISAGFTPRMTARLEDQARSWARSIVDTALQRGTCDFVEDVAYKLPMHMIADIVGIPHEDRDWLFSKTNDFLRCSDPEFPVAREEQREIVVEMFQYAQKLSEEKRKRPQDDVWTLLGSAEIEGDDGGREKLSEVELDMFFLLLTVAGSETTRNAISLGLLALLDNPEQLEKLRSDPTLMRGATEEILRFTSPVAFFRRTATRDTRIRDVSIGEGDNVTLWYPSGNYDDAVFDDPFRFDLARTPNPHVAFGGGGAHFCLGAHLARREISILFDELLARVGDIEPLGEATYSVQGIGNPILMSIEKLPVRLSAR